MHKSNAISRKFAKTERQGGFTLIEVLVSIVILSIGLLGSAGLIVKAMQSNKEARLQASATRLGKELGELMRANKTVAIATTANPYLGDYTVSTIPTTTVECFTARCTTHLQVAQWNIRDWLVRANAELPGFRAAICFDDAPYASNGIPQWACSGATGTAFVKMGWTTDSGAGLKHAATSPPMLVYPLIAGSTE